MNIVALMGRLTRNPDIRYAQGENAMAIARFTLAVDKNFKKKDDKANFINCVAFGKIAETVEKHVFKGSKIAVIGEWTTGSYKNKDGNTVYTNDCNICRMKSWQIGFITCAILKRMKSLISRFIILTQRRERKYTTVTAIYLIGFNQKHNRRKYGQIFIQGKKT